MMLPGALVVAAAVWHTCWTLGELRDDQELKESGPVFGAAAAFVAVVAAAFVWPPVDGLGVVPPTGVIFDWALLEAVNAMLLSFMCLFSFEFGVWSRRVDRYDGLLFGIKPPGEGEAP